MALACCLARLSHPLSLLLAPQQDDSPWLVVDAGSVLAHIFVEGFRQEYDLEGKWGSQDGANITRLAPRPMLHTLDSLTA